MLTIDCNEVALTVEYSPIGGLVVTEINTSNYWGSLNAGNKLEISWLTDAADATAVITVAGDHMPAGTEVAGMLMTQNSLFSFSFDFDATSVPASAEAGVIFLDEGGTVGSGVQARSTGTERAAARPIRPGLDRRPSRRPTTPGGVGHVGGHDVETAKPGPPKTETGVKIVLLPARKSEDGRDVLSEQGTKQPTPARPVPGKVRRS